MAKKVMVVDDSRSARLLARQALVEAGYEVLEADDGTTGEAAIASRNDVSLVLCDVNMPKKSGFEMMHSLREGGKSNDVVFVVLTTEGDAQVLAAAREAGAKGFIAKPFKPAILVAAVQRLVGKA